MFVYLLPISSGFADAGSRVVIKISHIPNLILLSGGFLAAVPFYSLWLYLEGIPSIDGRFWYVIAMHVPLLVAAFVLTIEAHRASPLMLTAPYLALTPAFLLVTTPIMTGVMPTTFGVLGVALISFGVYLLNVREGRASLWEPLRRIWHERGSRFMTLVSLIFAVTSNLDYLGFSYANAPTYLVIDHGAAGIMCGLLAYAHARMRPSMYEYVLVPKDYALILAFGAMTAISVIPHILSFVWIENVSYVIAAKRTGAILFTVAFGLLLAYGFFGTKEEHRKERSALRYRLPAIAIIVAGMVLVIVHG